MPQEFVIVVLYDNEGDRRGVADALRTHFAGVLIHEVADVPAMRTALATYSPNLVVSDMHVPPYTGTQVIEQVSHTGVPVVAMSGVSSTYGRSRYLEAVAAGAVSYIDKPETYADEVWQAKLVSVVTLAVSTSKQRDRHMEGVEQRLRAIHASMREFLDARKAVDAQADYAAADRGQIKDQVDTAVALLSARVDAVDAATKENVAALTQYRKIAGWLIVAIATAMINQWASKYFDATPKEAAATIQQAARAKMLQLGTPQGGQ